MNVMRVFIVAFMVALFTSISVFASDNLVKALPTYGFTHTIGGNGWDTGEDVIVDSLENVYFTGFFRGSNIDFNTTGSGSPDLKSSAGLTWQDVFLTRINSDGSYGYTYTFGGDSQDGPDAIATDTSGNIYLIGHFFGTDINFNTTGSGSPDLKSANGSMDFFLTKINSNGTYGYTYTLGGDLGDWGGGVATDNSGNVYITGFFQGTDVNFNTTGSGSPDLKTSSPFGDVFLTKINSDGSYGFTYTFGGTEQDLGTAIAVDSSGNMYIAGIFQGTDVNFNTTGSGSPDLKSANGSQDIFITKINSNGSYGYTYPIGGTGSDDPHNINTDSSGNIYIVGAFQGTDVNFNTTGSGSPDLKSSNGGRDMFLTKINSDGSYGYTYAIGGGSEDNANDVEIDSLGNIYVTGEFQGTSVNFNTTGGGSTDLKDGFAGNIFITRFTSAGAYEFTYTLGGTGLDRGFGIDVSPTGKIYIVGDFSSTSIDFDPTAGVDTKTSDGSDDIYLLNLNDPIVPSVTPTPTVTPIPTPTPTSTPSDDNEDDDQDDDSQGENNDPECPKTFKHCSHSGPTSVKNIHIINGGSILGDAISIVPKNASAHDIFIQINRKSPEELKNEKVVLPEKQRLTRVSEIFNFQSISSFNGYPLNIFDRPVTVIVPYDPYLFPGKNPQRLRIAKYDKKRNLWRVMTKNTVLHQFDHTIANTTKDYSYFTVVYY